MNNYLFVEINCGIGIFITENGFASHFRSISYHTIFKKEFEYLFGTLGCN